MNRTVKKKPYMRTALLGAMSISAYVLLFTHASSVMDYFVKGGIYSALPIITALGFSFVHGAFADGVLSILGLSAKGH